MMSTHFVQIFIILICLVYVYGEETLTIDTPSGAVKGLKIKHSETGKDLFEFRGVPYGKPTSGSLRFSKPEPVGKWEDTLDATYFKAACPQFGVEYIPEIMRPEVSEDCLLLNIHVPGNVKRENKKSVMVWMHGGGLITGHGHQYDGGRIATIGDVIVVTINYRLGMFGFLATDHPSSRGNYGLWDQRLALQWIHDNIAAFGGNPDSVTIFGQSAGASSVLFQSVNPSNKGLFQRVISMSGVIDQIAFQKKTSVSKHIKTFSDQTNCSSEDLYKFVDCLRGKTVDDILTASNPYNTMSMDKFEYEFGTVPIVDGDFFKALPLRSLENKNSDESQFFGSLDVMSGVMSNEGSMLYMSLLPDLQKHFGFDAREGIPSSFVCQGMVKPYVSMYFNGNEKLEENLCNYYSSNESLTEQSMKATNFYADTMFNYGTMKLLEHHSGTAAGKRYQYIFSKISPMPFGGPPPSWFKGSGHGDELIYIFDIKKPMTLTEDVVLSDKNKKYSNKMINYWTSFAKYGVPNGGEGTPSWKQFDMKDRIYLNFDDTISEKKNYDPTMVDFWSRQLKQMESDNVDTKDRDEL